jgi:hypothetical protein
MIRRKIFRQFAVILFVLAFLADAINVDEILGLTSFDRNDDPEFVDHSTDLNSALAKNLLNSLSFHAINPNSSKSGLELVDVDSPTLEASYVSREAIMLFIQETDALALPVSASTELNFYSLCKIQI